MNKRANLYLNIYELIAFLLALTCIGLSITLKELPYEIPFILKSSSLFIGTFFGILFLLIEIILFLLMKARFKVIYIIYILLDIGIGVFINSKYSFYGIIVFFLFSILKNIIRIRFVNNIYVPKRFQNYCKIFNITIDDFKKKKEKKEEIPEKSIKIKVSENTIKTKATKKKKNQSKNKIHSNLRTKES